MKDKKLANYDGNRCTCDTQLANKDLEYRYA